MQNSVPVNLCRKCITAYINASQTYNDILNGTNKDGKTCKSIYFDQDQFGVAEKIFQNSVNIWNSGSCSSKHKFKMYLFIHASHHIYNIKTCYYL